MSAPLIPTATRLFAAMGVNEKLPPLEYVERPVARISPQTMRQVERDLERWAAEGDVYAAEALTLLRERE